MADRSGPADGDGNGSVTLEVVARAAGVSRATVSRVINGDVRVNADIRRSVEREVVRLGYSPNRAARSLVTRRSDSVGLVIPEPTTKLFGDPFFASLVRGVSDRLSTNSLQLVLFAPQSRADEDRLGRYMTGGHLDGVLLVSLHGDDPLPGLLRRANIPFVVGGRPINSDAVSYVDMDNVGGARAAVEHLISVGARSIATVTGPLDMAAAQDRLAGYRSALTSARVEVDPQLEISGEFDQEVARARFAELLARRPDVDGVFAASDPMALGVLQALRAANRRVPDDVRVVGFDDLPIAASADPALSSVRQPIVEMGREMTGMLLDGISSDRRRVARRLILATELVVRASSRGGDAS